MKSHDDIYDIFLSYRRKGGFEIAKHLFDLLTRDGYRVSFDIDPLRSGDFNTELLRRIDRCTDFILILNKGAFDRSTDLAFDRNRDWLRIELAYALEKGKNIIPVMLSGFTEFPDNLPADIAAIARKNGLKYNRDYFDAFYNKLLRFFDCKPASPAQSAEQKEDPDAAAVKIETDLACRIFVDGEERGIAKPGEVTRLPLRGGSYNLRFESVENPIDCIEDRKFRITKDTEEWYTVALLPVRSRRETEEKAREQYLLKLPDDQFSKSMENDKYGLIDIGSGELLIPCMYERVGHFRKGLVQVEKDGKWGLIDQTGKEVIPCMYDDTYFFLEGLARVKKGGKWGFIDQTGKEVIPCMYNEAYSFREGLARVKKDGKWGFIDQTGKEVTPCMYDDADSFSEGLARVKKGGKWGFIDQTGKEVTPCMYDGADSFSEGLAGVKKDGKYGFIDQTGKEVTPCMYENVVFFQEGLARVLKDGKWGFIDQTGKEVIPCIYDKTYFFQEGLAEVKKGGKWGFIDQTGKEVIPCMYDNADSFSEGLAWVKKDGKWGLIDQTGKEVIPCMYDDAGFFSEGLAWVKKDGKWGFISKDNWPNSV